MVDQTTIILHSLVEKKTNPFYLIQHYSFGNNSNVWPQFTSFYTKCRQIRKEIQHRVTDQKLGFKITMRILSSKTQCNKSSSIKRNLNANLAVLTFLRWTDWSELASPVKIRIFICPRVNVLVFCIEIPFLLFGFSSCFTMVNSFSYRSLEMYYNAAFLSSKNQRFAFRKLLVANKTLNVRLS